MKNILLFLFSLSIFFNAFAQDTSQSHVKRFEISLITCGTGEELYSLFGHSGIRVKDNLQKRDLVYNYGTFDYNDPDFYKNYILGKLNYWLSVADYNSFIYVYQRENRSVKETVLNINDEDANTLVEKLEKNLLPENKVYLYDFIYANCATKIRDMFEMIDPQNPVEFGTILKGQKISYRQLINQYMVNAHWSRLGVNLLLGSSIDSTMTDFTSMFIPDFLEEGVKFARYKHQDFANETKVIFESTNSSSYTTFNAPFWLTLSLLVLVIFSNHIKFFHFLRPILNFIILFVTGLLGLLILFMWFGTDHQACNNNWNILWTLPTNVIIAFIAHKNKVWFKIYALAAISCIIVALIIHVIGLQLLPLTEILPLLGCLLYIYMNMYYQAIFELARQKKESEKTAV